MFSSVLDKTPTDSIRSRTLMISDCEHDHSNAELTVFACHTGITAAAAAAVCSTDSSSLSLVHSC